MHNISTVRIHGRKALAVLVSIALALALLGTMDSGTANAANGSSKPTIKVTRAATGKLVMKKGSTYKLGVKATGKKTTYKSSKPSVVKSLGKGKIKALKAGKATITITTKTGKAKATKKIKVTVVKKSKFKKVKSISVKASKTKLKPGQSTKLKTTFKPKKASNKNLLYKSSNNKVVKVSATGKITAVKAGKAKVTVTSADNKKAKKTVSITVVKNTQKTYTITFDSNGGSKVAAQKVAAGKSPKQPADPVKDGYAFMGWYRDLGFSEPFYFDSSEVDSNLKLYAKWNKTTASYFDLAANSEHITTGLGTDSNAVFTLNTDLQVDSIALYDASTYEEVTTLYDSGDYDGESGYDEIAGDGLYTGYVEGDYLSAGTQSYVAIYNDYDSNVVDVEYTDPIDDELLSTMENADSAISSLTDDGSFFEASDEEKRQQAEDLLSELEESGYIVENSVEYNEDYDLYSFDYGDGILGGISLKEFNAEENGPTAEDLAAREAMAGEAEMQLQDDRAIKDGVLGQVLILNAFPAFESEQDDIDFRTGFYEDLEQSWTDKGFGVTLDTDVTVDDFKGFDAYDIAIISSHGSVYSWGEGFLWLDRHSTPAICTPQRSGWDNDKTYSYELKNKYIVKVNGRYWVLPGYISDAYSGDDLDDTIVFSESCEFLGKEGNYDYSMSDAFENASVKSLVGFHNSVYAVYSRELMKTFVDYLSVGDTASQAFDEAKTLWGNTDKEWYENNFTDPYDSSRPIAKPSLFGDTSAKLVHDGIENGDFESVTVWNQVFRTIKKWNVTGDARNATAMGDALPKGSSSHYMAAVTTGIGSSDTATMDGGTEGSCISQAFVVPAGTTKVTFDYNFISEEPMEYVDSEYDDSFYVQVVVDEDEVYGETLESINTSKWKPIGHLNFPNGDETAYQTGWKSSSIDLSPYGGQIAALRFIVYDKGDSIYDSACLVDNVKLS